MHTTTAFRRVARYVREARHAPHTSTSALARAKADNILAQYAAPGYVVTVAHDAHPKHLRLSIVDSEGITYAASVHVLPHDVVVTATTDSGVSSNHVRAMLMRMDRL